MGYALCAVRRVGTRCMEPVRGRRKEVMRGEEQREQWEEEQSVFNKFRMEVKQ